MKCIIRVFFSILLFFNLNCFAYEPEEGKVTATLGPFYSRTNYGGGNSGSNVAFLGGAGVVAVGDINKNGSLEVGMFYSPRVFFREHTDLLIAEKTQAMHISMGYRRWINSYFSTSLSFYSSYSMGDPVVIYSDFTSGTEIDTSARDVTEYGLDGSMQADLITYDKVTLIFSGRYSLSLTSKDNERADQFGFFLGLRFLVQEDKKIESRSP